MESWTKSLDLNAPLEVRFSGPISPSSVNGFSVSVTDENGELLQVERRVKGSRLTIFLIVDNAMFSSPPQEAVVTLAGLPSPASVTLEDGRRLSRRRQLKCQLSPTLVTRKKGPPRLAGVEGAPWPLPDRLAVEGRMTLFFDGVLDPLTISPETCPLLPVRDGLRLAPLFPGVAWHCVGDRFTLRLDLPSSPNEMGFALRRTESRGLSGQPLSEALVVRLFQP